MGYSLTEPEESVMRGPALHTAEDATQRELRGASLRLFLWLVVCVIVGPLVRSLPLGQTTRTGMLAWLLVAMALYWLYAGLGYRPLLLVQLGIFSSAAALLAIKAGLVALGIHSFDILRATARILLIVGGGCAGANLGMMLIASLLRRTPSAADDVRPG
jgi:hypothetical protein